MQKVPQDGITSHVRQQFFTNFTWIELPVTIDPKIKSFFTYSDIFVLVFIKPQSGICVFRWHSCVFFTCKMLGYFHSPVLLPRSAQRVSANCSCATADTAERFADRQQKSFFLQSRLPRREKWKNGILAKLQKTFQTSETINWYCRHWNWDCGTICHYKSSWNTRNHREWEQKWKDWKPVTI